MSDFRERVQEYLEGEVDRCTNEINKLYWTFTRCSRGVPPAVANPGLYDRRNRARLALRKWKRRP